jgi:hypothetical protein
MTEAPAPSSSPSPVPVTDVPTPVRCFGVRKSVRSNQLSTENLKPTLLGQRKPHRTCNGSYGTAEKAREEAQVVPFLYREFEPRRFCDCATGKCHPRYIAITRSQKQSNAPAVNITKAG